MGQSPIGKAVLFPLLAVITIVMFAGGLGVVFILLNETALGEWSVIFLGVVLVVGVPAVAAFLARSSERG